MKNLTCILSIICTTFLSGNAQIFEINQLFITPGNDSRSANWVDLNNDGDLDIFFTNGKSGGQNNEAYINQGNGIFIPVTNADYVLDSSSSVGAVWADIDNMHGLDGFVTNWYSQNNQLYLTNSNGQIQQIENKHPVLSGTNSESATLGDIDGDNLLEIFVANGRYNGKNEFYKNLGNGNFLNLTKEIGVVGGERGRGVIMVDMNNDGMLDVFLAAEGVSSCEMFKGTQTGLEYVNPNNITQMVSEAMGSCWGDYDNDGDLDVYITTLNSKNFLFRNEGDFNFTLMDNDVMPQLSGNSFAANWGDVDNDGDLDLIVANAFYVKPDPVKNFFFINNGDNTFSQNTSDTVANVLGWTFGNAFGDYDKDGDLDLIQANCNAQAQPNHLFNNLTSQKPNPNSWAVFNCIGTISNTSAIGARVKLKTTINGNKVTLIREINAPTTYCGQNMLPVHFGLGNATQIDSVFVNWPSGLKEFFPNTTINNYTNLTEGTGVILSTKKQNINQGLKIEIFPNPAKNQINIALNNHEKGFLRLKLIGLNGQYIDELFIGNVQPFDNVNYKLKDNLPAGNYFLLGSLNDKDIIQSIVIN